MEDSPSKNLFGLKRSPTRILRRVSTMIGKMQRESYSSSDAVGVLTSGGDSQGMNAAVRAVVRMCLHKKVNVYAITEGYKGLIEGGDAIKKVTWSDVANIMHKGGTMIGSARSQEFRTEEGRYAATVNLLKKNITQLIIIGGDGSLTGADYLEKEWSNNVEKALKDGALSDSSLQNVKTQLKIYGLVGSIDNDFAGTSITIGADSALHRICEAVDSIRDTAYSHQRAFVIEVMGRHCGYLALTAALCCEADYVLLPECFQSLTNSEWKTEMKQVVSSEKANGKRTSLIIVAEGAVDPEGKKITCNDVKNILSNEMGLDTRITVLGHIQRGGNASAFDRNLATRLGADAALYIIDSEYNGSKIVSIDRNATVAMPMMELVAKTKKIGENIENKQYKELIEARGPSFSNFLKLFEILSSYKGDQIDEEIKGKTIGIVHLGIPTVGMNPITLCAAKYLINKGIRVLGVENGLEGLQQSLKNNSLVSEITIKKTYGLMEDPGSILGTRMSNLDREPLNMRCISNAIQYHKIDGLLIVGGSYALNLAKELSAARNEHVSLGIPKVVIPCSITNDLPRTFFSVGTDSCLNQIVSLTGSLRDSNCGAGKTIFFVETRSDPTGYLPIMAALTSGACKCYTANAQLTLQDIINDAKTMTDQCSVKSVKIVICAEGLNMKNSMDIDSLMKIYEKYSEGEIKCVKVVLGNLQEGCHPSPQDRKLSMKFGVKSSMKIINMLKDNSAKHNGQKTNGEVTKSIEMPVEMNRDLLLAIQAHRGTEFITYDECFEDQTDSSVQDWLSLMKALVTRLSDKDNEDFYCNDIDLFEML